MLNVDHLSKHSPRSLLHCVAFRWVLARLPPCAQVDSSWRSVEGQFSDIALLPKGDKPNPPEGLYVLPSRVFVADWWPYRGATETTHPPL